MANKIDLDKIDRKILAALFQDGRITKLALSEKVGLSPTPCFERIKKMQRGGVIAGYTADIDLPQIAEVSFYCVGVTLNNSSNETVSKLESLFVDTPEVLEAQAVLGSVDYILRVAARNVDHYQKVMDRLRTTPGLDLDYITYPRSKQVKALRQTDVLALLDILHNPPS